jgi:hypothetical protein
LLTAEFSNNSVAADVVSRGHEVKVCPSVPDYAAGWFWSQWKTAGTGQKNQKEVAINSIFP